MTNTKKRWSFMTVTGLMTLGSVSGLAPEKVLHAEKASNTALHAFNILDHGAVGDGETLNTDAFSKTISVCTNAGDGTVLVPPGVYLSGPVYLQSNMTLFVEAGATIKASGRLEDYRVEADHRWGQGSGESVRAGLITARDAKHVAITGRGVIDGNAMAFHDADRLHGRIDKQYTRQGEDYMDPKCGTEHGPIAHGQRPGNLIRSFNCRNVLLRSVTIQDSPTWTVQFSQCDIVNVLEVNINSHESGRRVPNDDGVDIFNSRNIHVSNCDVQTGDDCIAVFGGQAVTVANCTFASHFSGLRVGYVGGDIRDCTYKNLVIHSNRGISLFVQPSRLGFTMAGNLTPAIGRSAFTKQVEVFGLHVYATNTTGADKLLHAANVLAEYIDNDEDGVPDNPKIMKALLEGQGAIVMTKTEGERTTGPHPRGQGLYGDEAIANARGKGEFDASLEEVLHMVTDVGWAGAYPEVFGREPGTAISNALDKARGGRFMKTPERYPDGAWFTYNDETCDYDCMNSEYIYWVLTSILGAQDFPGRYEQIRDEWRLNTRAKVMAGDPVAYALFTDPKYTLPTVLPDGKYRARKFTIQEYP